MAEEETDPNDIVDQVFAESDAFRLAIRGMVLIEELVDDAIDEAFRDGLPAELARLSRPSRVSLAVALELITSELAKAIETLGRIRNAFAHTMADEVSEQQIAELQKAATPFVPDVYDWENDSTFDLFYAAMIGVFNATIQTIERAEELRKRNARELVAMAPSHTFR